MTDARPARLAGLDVFRGLAVAGMILVNNPGSWSHVWWPLDHAEWHGWTPTDLVFPAFLCAMGVALGLSFPRKIEKTGRAAMWGKIARRTLTLIALGLALELIAEPHLSTLRYFGVLQRIGLCYGIAASFIILTARRDAAGVSHLNVPAIVGAALALLLLYWALLTFVPVPGYGAGQLDPAGNLTGYIDRTLFGTAHIWGQGTDASGAVVYDPEGLLSTLPALANVLLAMLAAVAWRIAPQRAASRILIGGVILVALGLAADVAFPINKRLWTSSFALFTTGASAVLLAACMGAAARPALRKALTPLYVLGMNAILGYILAELIAILFTHKIVPTANGAYESPQACVFALAGRVVADPFVASFLYAVAMVVLIVALLIPFHRRAIHFRL